jgi:glutathione synthase/RimK-type ligase-like ATP-grasp enzyme
MTSPIALVTCSALPNLEDDDHPLVDALAELGHRPVTTLWDDPSIRWADFGAVVVRSPVDYVERLEGFLGWAASVERLHNSFPTLRWNTDKAYVRDLEAAGLTVVATQWLTPGEPLEERDGPFVVKPAVGVGGIGVGRYERDEHPLGAAHVRRLHDAGQTALVQPYLRSVEDEGEVSLVYCEGTYSHAVRSVGFVPEADVHPVPCRPDAGERQLADRVIDHVTRRFGPPLYARVDLLETPDGPAVNELEVTDPILHLRRAPGSAHRFAQAIVRRLIAP